MTTAAAATLSRICDLGPIIDAGNRARLERKELLRRVARNTILSQTQIA